MAHRGRPRGRGRGVAPALERDVAPHFVEEHPDWHIPQLEGPGLALSPAAPVMTLALEAVIGQQHIAIEGAPRLQHQP